MSSLAATQSDGFYFPPNYDGRRDGGLSKFNTNGQYKGSNQYQQSGIIRFELPFDAWCLQCEAHLSKGLRFNAKKDKAGKYFTTTIWSFAMKCPKCAHSFLIKTDPANDTYDYAEGLRVHEQDFEPELDDGIVRATTDEERSMLLSNPMYRLQHDKEDKTRAATVKEQLESLIDLRDVQGSQDYDMNALLRRGNRDKKKHAALLLKEGEARGLSIPLVDEDETDRKRAKLATFRSSSSALHGQQSGFAVSERKKMTLLQSESIFSAHAVVVPSSSSSSNKRSSQHRKSSSSSSSSSNLPQSSEARKQAVIRSAMNKQAMLGINTSHLKVGGSSQPGKVDNHNVLPLPQGNIVVAPTKNMALAMLVAYTDDDNDD